MSFTTRTENTALTNGTEKTTIKTMDKQSASMPVMIDKAKESTRLSGTEKERTEAAERSEVRKTGGDGGGGKGAMLVTPAAAAGAPACAVIDGARRDVTEVRSGESERTALDEIRKELVVNVEIEGDEKIGMLQLLRAVENTCGRVVGCRTKNDGKWELTMGNARGRERLLDGFKINNTRIIASEIIKNTKIVSFLSLPIYITDKQIFDKLEQWGVEPMSPIKRRKWAGTDIYDGTRFLKVKFNEQVTSLPYSTKFETVEGMEYFRVLHDNQEKVCRLCLQAGHIVRDCPDFRCFQCGKTGHYARECTTNGAEATNRDKETTNNAGVVDKEVTVEEEEQTEASVEREEDMEDSGSSGEEEEEEDGEHAGSSEEVSEVTPRGRISTPQWAESRGSTSRVRSRSERRTEKIDSSGSLTCGKMERDKNVEEMEEDSRWVKRMEGGDGPLHNPLRRLRTKRKAKNKK